MYNPWKRMPMMEGDGAGAGGSAGAGEGSTGGEAAGAETDITVTTDAKAQADARKAEFDRLIKNEYADLYNERVRQQIDRRFKNQKDAEALEAKYAPMLQKLAGRYGVDAADFDAISAAMDEDDSYYEKEADERGLTVKELKYIKQLEATNAQLTKMRDEAENQKRTDAILKQWDEEGQALKQTYPGFDFDTELQNQDFYDLISKGVPLKTAYQVIHQDEILGGAMQYTAQQVREKTVQGIQARANRPRENGAGSAGSGVLHTVDPGRMTKAERAEYERRALRGERITFKDE